MGRGFNITPELAEAISAKNRAAKNRKGKAPTRAAKPKRGEVPDEVPSMPELLCMKCERQADMNQTEARFAAVLEGMKRDGHVAEWRYENEIFDLGSGITYRPDFPTIFTTGHKTYYEIKGEQIWDKNRIKFLIAAAMFTEYTWVMVQLKKGEWRELYRIAGGRRRTPQAVPV